MIVSDAESVRTRPRFFITLPVAIPLVVEGLIGETILTLGRDLASTGVNFLARFALIFLGVATRAFAAAILALVLAILR